MSHTAIMHVAIESWVIINCLLACWCILLDKDSEKEEKLNIFLMQLCGIVLLENDSLAWIFRGKPGTMSYYILQISNTMVFICNYSYMMIFTRYMWRILTKPGEKIIQRVHFIYGLCSFAIILMVLSRIGNFFFYFDENNLYHRGRGYLVTQIIAVIGMAIGISILVQYGNRVRKNIFIALCSYFVLPAIATIIIIFHYGLSLQALAIVISAQITFAVKQINIRKSLAEAKEALEKKQIQLEENQSQLEENQEQLEKKQIQLEENQAQLEEALLEAEKANLAKTEFLNRMSHDIRTPINGILGMLNIADRSANNLQKQEEAREKIRISASHLLSLVNDVLEISKLESGKVIFSNEVFDMEKLIEECKEIIEVKAEELEVRINFMNELGENTKWIGSPLHISQIILNITGNALKFNKLGGIVNCTIKYEKTECDAIQLIIEDTGIGISEEFLPHIYEPFSQAVTGARSKYEGSGLGMSITKKLVEQMNGKIFVESQLGVGTTFEVVLPLQLVPKEANVDKEEVEVAVDISGSHILLVDDNELNLEIAQFVLEDAGAKVTTALNGKIALDLFIESQVDTFDAILMDIMMPVMDGLEATRMIRASAHEKAKTIPIIAVTANAFKEDVEKVKEAGMNEHLAKPIDVAKMLKTVSDYLHR